jgi:hypothetical protein
MISGSVPGLRRDKLAAVAGPGGRVGASSRTPGFAMIEIRQLAELSSASPPYVEGLVSERIADLQALPEAAGRTLASSGSIVDVGCGEGTWWFIPPSGVRGLPRSVRPA